ncbi:MAG: creatininase family protein [Cyanobacteria bacterium RI_101]|nr:creatininase family protein [Cyanobacteria bacterium RI_101]
MLHGFIPPARYFAYLTWPEIAGLPERDHTVILQPVGAVEQHGPHLPLAVDAAIGAGVLGRALEKLDPQIPAYSLPPLYYGKSNEHSGFPGTITLTTTTLLALLAEIAESLYQAGFRKWVLVNAHGGQPQIMELAARDIRARHPDFWVFPLFVWNVPFDGAEALNARELSLGLHGGELETSLMMALLPEQVRIEKLTKEYPEGLPSADGLLSLEGKLPFAWLTRDLSRSGVIGDATGAARAKGERLLESLAQGWVQVITEVYQFQPPRPHEPN